jgi:PadR family transcriptional regulator PadR
MTDSPSPLLAGTLDLLILKTLSVGALHGYGIAQHIHRLSNDALRVEEGSLYPALQRMQAKGWVASETKKTPTGRQARYYRITAAGRRQLSAEEQTFRRSVAATTLVLEGTDQ